MASFSAFGGDLLYIALIVLHELSPCLSPMFIWCFGDLVVYLFQGRRGRISRSEIISCSHLFQYIWWDWLCIETVSSRVYMVWCCVQKDGTQDLFSLLAVGWKLSLSSYLLTISAQLSFFKSKLVRWGIGLMVRFIRKLMRIGRWSDPRFVFVCQLVEVIREANDTSGEDWRYLVVLLVNDCTYCHPTTLRAHTGHGYFVVGPGFGCTSESRRCSLDRKEFGGRCGFDGAANWLGSGKPWRKRYGGMCWQQLAGLVDLTVLPLVDCCLWNQCQCNRMSRANKEMIDVMWHISVVGTDFEANILLDSALIGVYNLPNLIGWEYRVPSWLIIIIFI